MVEVRVLLHHFLRNVTMRSSKGEMDHKLASTQEQHNNKNVHWTKNIKTSGDMAGAFISNNLRSGVG